jgi:hypothetical protein
MTLRANKVGVSLATVNLLLWFVFLVVRSPISASRFREHDRLQRLAEERALRDYGMSMSIVSDQPFIVAQRPINAWGDASMHGLLLLELPAFLAAALFDQLAANAMPSLVRTYIVAVIILVLSTAQWLVIGLVCHYTHRRIFHREQT